MDKCLQKRIWLVVMLVLVVAGCGRKEAPQPAGEIKPQIVDLKYAVNGSVLRLDFELQGDERGVGFQIDRTRIDPYCQCPGFWRRYLDVPPRRNMANKPAYKIITLKNDTVDYLFRIRAIDAAGNLGPWSKMIRARGVNLLK
ncbi:MAG: hypothetical protein ACE5DZ_07730 [Mariprofundus sp.]